MQRFVPRKRTDLDGRVWWCVWDNERKQYSSFLCHGVYRNKRATQFAIEYAQLHYQKMMKK